MGYVVSQYIVLISQLNTLQRIFSLISGVKALGGVWQGVKGLFHSWSKDYVRVLGTHTRVHCLRQAHKSPYKDDPIKRPNKGVLPIVLDHGVARGSNGHGCVGQFLWKSIQD